MSRLSHAQKSFHWPLIQDEKLPQFWFTWKSFQISPSSWESFSVQLSVFRSMIRTPVTRTTMSTGQTRILTIQIRALAIQVRTARSWITECLLYCIAGSVNFTKSENYSLVDYLLSRSSFRPINEMSARLNRTAPIPSRTARWRMFLLDSTNFSHPVAFRIESVRWRNGSWMNQRAITTRTMAIQTHPGFRTPKGFRLDLR